MRTVTLAGERDFDGWRSAARALALEGVSPDQVEWRVDGGGAADLFAEAGAPAAPPAAPPAFSVPRAFLTLAETVVGHDDPERFALLYGLLWRLRAGADALDQGPLVQRLEAMAREVRRAAIGRKLAPEALTDGMAKTRLSEAEREGLADAEAAERRLAPGDNARAAWAAIVADAKRCTRCHLHKHATQTVFGEGPLDARIMFVGEQPGDHEDLAGRPFVGPAGQVFDRALADAGVDRGRTYVTNAVKHFKFERRGSRRIHQKPQGPEIEACRWWVEQERQLVRPPVTVALGATAARSLFGKVVTITAMRGRAHLLPDDEGGEAWVTVHPSFLLRVPEEDRKRAEYARFVEDLRRIGERAKALA